MRFADTNILLYSISRDPKEHEQQAIAGAILNERDLAVSVQVLQEFYAQATRTSRPDALTQEQAVEFVTVFTRFPVQPTTTELVRAAMAARARFGLSYWDAAIVEAARMLGCEEVLSEDLSDGEDYGGLVVRNPFRRPLGSA